METKLEAAIKEAKEKVEFYKNTTLSGYYQGRLRALEEVLAWLRT